MPKEKKKPIPKKKQVAPAPVDPEIQKLKEQRKKIQRNKGGDFKKDNPLFEARPRIWGIGQGQRPKRDLTRYVRWPAYIVAQRRRRILYQRLKVPPAINQFSKTLDKTTATQLFKLLMKYRPEDKISKRKRLLALADSRIKAEKARTEAAKASKAAKASGQTPAKVETFVQPTTKKPHFVKFGVNHVTHLIEQKKAKLVIIANDVDPIELVVWLPTLCRKMQVPYCIVKCRSRLGRVVRQKTATCLAVTSVSKEDVADLGILTQAIKENYNDRYEEHRKQWGGGRLSLKSQQRLAKRQKLAIKEGRITKPTKAT
jgi:large subunit ribosomal protein L7Ae